jgi:hypothetical protein
MPLERLGSQSVQMTRIKPQVRGGVCEYCGTLDGTKPATEQYKLCSHYKPLMDELERQGQEPVLRCTYCPDQVDPNEVVRSGILNVHEHPDKPNVWITVCNRFECTSKHEKRFVRNV